MPRNDAPKRVVSVAGVVGSDPEIKDTDYGEVLEFRLAVTTSYEEGSESKWFDVSVWNEGLIESCDAEIFKGAKVAVEGTYSVRESGGREYPKISAAKVGLIGWLARSKGNSSTSKPKASTKPARVSRDEDDEEEEEAPRRRPAARSTSSRSTPSRSRAQQDDPVYDSEGDDLPW